MTTGPRLSGCTQLEVPQCRVPWFLGWTGKLWQLPTLVPTSSSSLPPAATMGNAWQPEARTCASVPRAMEGLCVTTRTTLPMPAQPSSATTGSATSQTKGSPTACASQALVGSTVSEVSLLCSREGAPGGMQQPELDSCPSTSAWLCHPGDLCPWLSHTLSLKSLSLKMGAIL